MNVPEQIAIPGVSRFITPAQHAIIDYSVAGSFFVLGARNLRRSRAAASLAFINGALIVATSMLTDYPGGIWRKISFTTHGALDLMLAGFTGVGPVLFGFADREEAVPFYGQALAEAGVIAATDWDNTAAARA